jgi:hypothetical protein
MLKVSIEIRYGKSTITKRPIRKVIYRLLFDTFIYDRVVPAGFETDFATIPKIFWPIVDIRGLVSKASVLHDYMYRNHTCSRRKTDKIFLKMLIMEKVPMWQAVTMYIIVRWFGNSWWKLK